MPVFESSTNLSARGLGEPEGPLVHQRVLDVEVVGRVEDGELLDGVRVGDLGLLLAVRGRDGDLGERTLLVGDLEGGRVGGGHGGGGGGGSHDVCVFVSTCVCACMCTCVEGGVGGGDVMVLGAKGIYRGG